MSARDELETEVWRVMAQHRGIIVADPVQEHLNNFVDAILTAADRYTLTECRDTTRRQAAADAEMAARDNRGRYLRKQRAGQQETP